ncbi:MAG: T9SS type A sorting domain-containing protein [Dysgonamonadaceae bacterium]|nr:T9SS type A sorting domain-containing protein [Dysgonamonadaceae bacterium]
MERLIADFDVKVGDEVTIYSKNWGGERPVEIKEVDSILIDNSLRKRVNIVNEYKYNWDFPSDSWVEGFGSIIYGLFFPYPEQVIDGGDPPKFLCLHQDDRLVYQNPNYTSCFVEDSGTEDLYELCIQDCMKNNPDKTYSECAFYCLYWYWNSVPEIDRNKINIYLSPANDILWIETNGDRYLYKIYNNRGALICTDILQDKKVDVSALASGIYFIVLYSENNRPVVVRKFIKH